MKTLRTLLILLLAISAHAAFVSSNIWEIEPTSGNDNYGCGWDSGSSGSDFSTSLIQAFDGASVECHNGGAGSTVTCSGDSPASNQVGNTLHVLSGTNFLVNFYRVTAINTGTHVYTLDKNVTSGAGSGMVGNFGGPCRSFFAGFMPLLGTGNAIYVKAESTIQVSTAIATSVTGSVSATTPANRIVGYTSARGDQGRVSLQMVTIATVAVAVVNSQWSIENFDIDCNSITNSTGVYVNAVGSSFVQILNTKVRGSCYCGMHIPTASAVMVSSDEITGVIGSAGVQSNASGVTVVSNSWIHDNTCDGIILTGPGTIMSNVISNNTGASSDGVSVSNGNTQIIFNTVYNSGRDNIHSAAAAFPNSPMAFIKGNLLESPGRYNNVGGNTTAGTSASWRYDGNAYYLGSGTANRFDLDDTGTSCKICAIGTYTNTKDVIMTQSALNNPGANDFTINTSTGGGLQVRGNGWPQTISGITVHGNPDFGPFQHPDPVGNGVWIQ